MSTATTAVYERYERLAATSVQRLTQLADAKQAARTASINLMKRAQNTRLSVPPVAEDRVTGAAGPDVSPVIGSGRSTLAPKKWPRRHRARHRAAGLPSTGHAGLALVIPVGMLGTALVILAAVSHHLGYLVHHLPLPSVTVTPDNAAFVLVFVVVGAGFVAVQRMLAGIETPAYELIDRAADVGLHPTADGGWVLEPGPVADDPWFRSRAEKIVRPDGVEL